MIIQKLSTEEKDLSLERELFCFRRCFELLEDSELIKEEYEPYVWV